LEDLAVSPVRPLALPGRIIVQYDDAKKAGVKVDEATGMVFAGGIFVPRRESKLNKHVAEVIDVGAPTDRQEELFVRDVRVGDKIIANPRYGTEFQVGEGETAQTFHIFRQFEIVGKLPATLSQKATAEDAEGD
jgi:co-chaperonin GroES (HSP10)